ncbi:MAG: hypothetical protein F4125_04535 [Acidimicrobiaceae bacterium]|nr:hypothetical protein [Acidimicrobiaceae bacterium]
MVRRGRFRVKQRAITNRRTDQPEQKNKHRHRQQNIAFRNAHLARPSQGTRTAIGTEFEPLFEYRYVGSIELQLNLFPVRPLSIQHLQEKSLYFDHNKLVCGFFTQTAANTEH